MVNGEGFAAKGERFAAKGEGFAGKGEPFAGKGEGFWQVSGLFAGDMGSFGRRVGAGMGMARRGGMPAPARWNTPGLTWATPGLTWGGAVPAKSSRTMNNLKAKTDFSGYAAAE